MKGYRFRMESVLRVRRLQEEQARATMLQARLEESRARTETGRRWGLFRRAADAGLPDGEGSAWVAERDRQERLAMAVLASRAAEQHAVDVAATRLADWEAAARDLATMERLDERQRALFVQGVLAAEQRELDEQATMRAARDDRRRAGVE